VADPQRHKPAKSLDEKDLEARENRIHLCEALLGAFLTLGGLLRRLCQPGAMCCGARCREHSQKRN